MKRFVWLLLTVCSLAFAQVQPADWSPAPTDVCDCCAPQTGCDMPDCVPPPAAPVLVMERPAAEVRTETRQTPKPAAPSVVKFYSAFAVPAPHSLVSLAPVLPVRAASVPLFRAHCSFRI